MTLINPTVAKRERHRLKLSLDELAKRAGVNKATLHRIERGVMTRNAEHVVARLAKTFGIPAEKLTGADDARDEEAAESVFSYRSQFNVRLSHEARNALALVAKRYGVKPVEVIEFAPLLFHLAASETLAERGARLARLRAVRDGIDGLHGQFGHITERLLSDWQGEELERLEERSIAARDIRGELLDESGDMNDPRPLEYDDAAHNPFIGILRERLSAVQVSAGGDTIDYWMDGMSPRYEICRDVALEYLGGDTEAAEAVVDGRVALHELPKDFRTANRESDRARWVRERAAEMAERNAEWLENIDIKDLGL